MSHEVVGVPERPAAVSQPTRSLADMVHDALVDAIYDSEMQPGERLRESDIARRFDVSRTPVREAFRRLEVEGWITQTPHSGVQVVELDRSRVMELYSFREVLEGTAAGLAARHADRAEIELMQHIHRTIRTAEGSREQTRLNRTLHDTIFGAARNPYLLAAHTNLRASFACLRGSTLAVDGRLTDAAREHGEIISAIGCGDAERAQEAARVHIREARRIRLMMMTGLTASP